MLPDHQGQVDAACGLYEQLLNSEREQPEGSKLAPFLAMQYANFLKQVSRVPQHGLCIVAGCSLQPSRAVSCTGLRRVNLNAFSSPGLVLLTTVWIKHASLEKLVSVYCYLKPLSLWCTFQSVGVGAGVGVGVGVGVGREGGSCLITWVPPACTLAASRSLTAGCAMSWDPEP